MKNLFLLPVLFLFLSCLIPGESLSGEFSILSWNVQNLFDGVSDGNEYDEYDPALSDWDEEGMRVKLEHLQEVLYSLGDALPDVLLLQEVENREVLLILNDEYLDGSYVYVDAWKDRATAISCGVLSRFPPKEVHLHFPGRYGKRELRPLVEMHFDLEGEELVLFNNHWKSRTGGQAATEEARIMASSVLASRVRELRAEGLQNIVAAGDFNGSVEDFRSGGSQTAQLPVDEIKSTAWRDSLFVGYSGSDCSLSDEKTVLFSPWREMENDGAEGSYFYQNRWMKLDHFFLDYGLLDGSGWEYESSRCLSLPLMTDELGRPMAWESWRSAGYSDHFPLFMILRKEEE